MTATEDGNKALVIEAFDTLFNRRDYAGAEGFWSPDYIQHSAHIPPGRAGLFDLVKALPAELRSNINSPSATVTTSCCMAGFPAMANRPTG